MKKVYFLLFLLFLINLFSIEFTIAQEQNLLLNPSFEDGGNHFEHWMIEGTATYIYTESWHAYHGSWSFGIGNDLKWASGGNRGCVFQVLLDPESPRSLYPVIPGDVFTFKMWIMTEEGYNGKASLKIEFFDYDRRLGLKDKPLASFQSEIHTSLIVGSWQKETVKGTVPSGAVSVVVSCLSEDMDKGSKYVFFDAGAFTITSNNLLVMNF